MDERLIAGRFRETDYFLKQRFGLGEDVVGGGYFLSIPVVNRMADYDEFYAIDEATYVLFQKDMDFALQFAEAARRRQLDERLILPPGSDRGVPMCAGGNETGS